MNTTLRGDITGPGNWKELSTPFEVALRQLPDALKAEGFGIITEVDIQETLRKKLGVAFRKYRIFGACNPSFAHKALENDPRIGLLLPCNVVLYQTDENKAVIGFVDPMQTLGAMPGNAVLAPIAQEVTSSLQRVMDAFA